MQQLWTLAKIILGFVVVVSLVYIIVQLILPGFVELTGVELPQIELLSQEGVGERGLWDWLNLLILPTTVIILAMWVSIVFQERTTQMTKYRTQELRLIEEQKSKETREIEENRANDAREIEQQRAQEAVLQSYLDQMTHLVLRDGLDTANPHDSVANIARAHTLTALSRLTGARKASVIQFLYESKLIGYTEFMRSTNDGVEDVTPPIINLYQADLREAQLIEIYLHRATLAGVNLSKSDLSGSYLIEANLAETDLTEAYLYKTNLVDANLRDVHLNGANLTDGQLMGANLRQANLSEAVLHEADLSGADLTAADLTNAELTGANLTECIVTADQLATARSLHGAKLPPNIANKLA
ncbi:MAG: hypothetical protein GFH27_549431n14 [Chloroflexi bacterium AL-W]|nr:hypothetical protein [Chloroflexi bacterium AL-N1]NOK71618.1 hypothetical protein [Chloroflexi bacterium AL-N10]NOK78918.1 hypothetical protein [Chloroflexi bacterium AL-N5]NOK86393.1 hypothetical protein [Chloroflexi bacterium AL-W]